MAVKLQDAPSGQVVRGSVFLRNPSHVNELCSPNVDFSLSSDRDFILLNLPVTAPLPPVAAQGLPFCSPLSSWKHLCLLIPLLPSSPPTPVVLCLLVCLFPSALSLTHSLSLSSQIPQERARICRLHLLRGAPKVQLMVQSSWLRDSLSKQTDMQGVNLLFSSRRGHLFLQTDQPVYNPGQRGESRCQGLHLSCLPSHLSEVT